MSLFWRSIGYPWTNYELGCFFVEYIHSEQCENQIQDKKRSNSVRISSTPFILLRSGSVSSVEVVLLWYTVSSDHKCYTSWVKWWRVYFSQLLLWGIFNTLYQLWEGTCFLNLSAFEQEMTNMVIFTLCSESEVRSMQFIQNWPFHWMNQSHDAWCACMWGEMDREVQDDQSGEGTLLATFTSAVFVLWPTLHSYTPWRGIY